MKPPYVIVLECVGMSGGARSRVDAWARVLVDPPPPPPPQMPLPVLTFA
jgi:hypothetical protein